VMIKYVKFQLATIEKKSVMMGNVYSALIMKDNKHSIHVDPIHAKKEKSFSLQDNVNYVVTT
jgi:membrane protein CcdC involved in cytochrome C biogenesis